MYDSKIEIGISYIHGRIEAQLEAFAAALNITPSELTSRLGTLLLAGTQERAEDTMSNVRRKTAKAYKTIRKMEMVSSPRKNGTRKTKRLSKIKQFWANMTPEERSAEVKRRRAKSIKNKAA